MTKRRTFIRESFAGMAGLTVGGIAWGHESFASIPRTRPRTNGASSASNTYTLLTTAPPYGSQNVGDELIAQRTRELVSREKGDVEFMTIFREEDLGPHLERINATRAVLMPGFPVRDAPMYPRVYQLVQDLSRIRVPMIPIGGNWNVYPGDAISRRSASYSEETRKFLSHIAGQVKHVSCREYYTCEVLQKNGVENTLMTGDPAWFLLSSIGKPMERPQQIRRVVFSPPLSPYYVEQAKRIMEMIAGLFPDAERICAFHLFDLNTEGKTKQKHERSAAMSAEVTAKNESIRNFAATAGYEVKQMAGDVNNLEFYQSCDLHVGYECHAHLNFFSRRKPSILIAEDARGVGFNYTLGVGGFNGFQRAQERVSGIRKSISSGYATSIDELVLAPPRTDLHLEISDFLTHELESGFRRYIGLAAILDDVYEKRMRPFIQSLP